MGGGEGGEVGGGGIVASVGSMLLSEQTYTISWSLRNGPVRAGLQPKLSQTAPFKILPQVLRSTSLAGKPCAEESSNSSWSSSSWSANRRRLLDHSDAGDAVPRDAREEVTMCLPIKEGQKLIFSAVHSSSRQFSALSTITVSLQFNVDLEPAVEITITGLGNSQTPDDDKMPVRVMSPPSIPGAGASLFVGKDGAWDSGVWRREAGHLVLQVAAWARLEARHMIVLTFLLRNPAQEWLGDTPIIYASHAVSSDGYAGGGDLHIGPVVAGNRFAQVEEAFSYLQPAMLRIVPKIHPTIHAAVRAKYMAEDMARIQGWVYGANLGSADYSQGTRPGSTGCEVSGWKADSSISCLVAAGVGGGPACVGSEDNPSLGHCGSSLMVTISEGLVSTVSLAFAYHEPYTTSIIPKNGPTAGGYFVEASGLYFGTSDYSPSIQLENRVCEATVWVSDSFALCKVPEIERSVLTSAIITVASQTAEREKNALFAYNAPKITSIYYSNGPTTGGTIITLFGEQFGLENNIVASRIGPSSTNSTDWQSDSVITVLTAAGLGRVQTFLLSIIKIQIEYMNPDAEEPVFLFDKPVYMLYVFMYMTYVYSYVCIYVCTCICAYVHVCVYVHAYVCMYICTHTRICTHILTHTYTYIPIYMYTYTHIHISYTHIHMYTNKYIYMYIYIHIYIHTHTHMRIYTYKYTHIYIYASI